jgi:hypothetical protein
MLWSAVLSGFAVIAAFALGLWVAQRESSCNERYLWRKLDEVSSDNKVLTDALLKKAGVPVIWKERKLKPAEGWYDTKRGNEEVQSS